MGEKKGMVSVVPGIGILRVWLVVILLGYLLIGRVHAQEAESVSDIKAKAMQSYRTAAKYFDNGQYDKALSGYSNAYKLHPHPSFLYMVARSYELDRKYRKALEIYRQVRKHENVNVKTRGRASNAIIELEKLFPTKVLLRLEYTPIDSRVEVDGLVLGKKGRARAKLSPGQHTLKVRQDGYRPYERKLDLRQPTGLMVHLDKIPSAVPLVPDELGTTYAWRTPVGWSAVGFGLLASGLGTWSLLEGSNMADKANQSITPAAYDAHKEAASQQTALGAIGVGLGVAALGAGIYLLLSGPNAGDSKEATVALGVNGGQVRW